MARSQMLCFQEVAIPVRWRIEWLCFTLWGMDGKLTNLLKHIALGLLKSI
jgi:hypothetical protein